ncbi:MAG: FAD-dependent thymidylate synthase [Methanomethylophilus sp.]
MNVKLVAYTPDADRICAAAARSCYAQECAGDLLELDCLKPEKILNAVMSMGHESVIEHAVFTFSVSGVSRVLTHQLVRHRIASFSQQSQRYIPMTKPAFVEPETVKADRYAHKIFTDVMKADWNAYNALVKRGVAAEDARYVLPNACTTNITITMNARELRHFFAVRCCNRAQWEIRAMADEMLRQCKQVSPFIFQDAGPGCVRGPCPEGKKSCGHSRKGDFEPATSAKL